MSAQVFTANAGTDQLAIVAHGFNTGDGPGATRNLGGALPGGLAPVTDYWIIRDDADHVRLADSSAHAMAGVAIDLLTNGTGTNWLEVGIPYRRARTYAALSQVKSVDLDSIQDALDALHAYLTGQPQTIWKRGLITKWKRALSASLLTNATVSQTKIAANADACLIDGLEVGDFPEGTTIAGGRVLLFGTAAAQDAVVNVRLNKADGTTALLLTAVIHNPPAAWALYDLGLDGAFPAGHVMVAGETLAGTVSFPKSTAAVGSIGIANVPG